MDLKDIRVEIDSLDEQIVELFKKRMDCSVRVAESKRESGTSILNLKREEQVLDRVEELGGEYGKYARLLYGSIMELSRDLQYTIINGDTDLFLQRKPSLTFSLINGVLPVLAVQVQIHIWRLWAFSRTLI